MLKRWEKIIKSCENISVQMEELSCIIKITESAADNGPNKELSILLNILRKDAKKLSQKIQILEKRLFSYSEI